MTENPIEGEQPFVGPRHHSRQQVTIRKPLRRSPFRLAAYAIAGLLALFLLVRLVWFVFEHPLSLVVVAVTVFFFRSEIADLFRGRGWRRLL